MTNVYALLPRLRCSRSRPAKKLGDRNLAVFPSTADTFGTLLDPRFRDVGKYIHIRAKSRELFYLEFFPDSGDVSINLLERTISPFGLMPAPRILSEKYHCSAPHLQFRASILISKIPS